MSDSEIKIGDLVMLKSGGPVMTVALVEPVVEYHHDGSKPTRITSTVHCTWFDHGVVTTERFDERTLAPWRADPFAAHQALTDALSRVREMRGGSSIDDALSKVTISGGGQ